MVLSVIAVAIIGLLLLSAILAVAALPVASVGSRTGPTAVSAIVTAPAPSSTGTVAGTVHLGGIVALTPSTFWSVDAQTKCATCISTNATVDSFLNETPFSWVRYGEGTDSCNETTNTVYSSNGAASSGCAFSVSALQTWCRSLTTACHSILSLPGENNNSAEDAAIAKYIVTTLGFQPDFWSIGNEPTGWTHFGIPWVHWSSTDASKATPMAYAYDVRAAIAAVLLVDPAAKFIGIETACSCNTAWLQDVALVDGSAISAVAYHSYPSGGSATPTLTEFYQPLSTSSNLSSSYATVRADISSLCTRCSTLPIFVNEYNAGPGAAPSSLAGSYANAVFLAASVAQALDANVSQLTVFNLQTGVSPGYGYALLNGAGTVGPTGTLFSSVLSHLAVGTVFGGGVASSLPDAWSVVTRNSTSESLLVADTNLTYGVNVSTATSFLVGASAAVYQWSPSLGTPSATSGVVQAYYTVPPQGILLLTFALPTASSGNGSTTVYPVNVTERGLPAGTPWWASFGRGLTSSTSSTIAFHGMNGSYAFRVGAAGYTGQPAAGTIRVNASGISQNITFVAGGSGTFRLVFTETGLPAATLWSVTVDGVLRSSTTPTLALMVENGLHHFAVGGLPGYSVSPSSGTVTMLPATGDRSIVFTVMAVGVGGASESAGAPPSMAGCALEAAVAAIAFALMCELVHRLRRRSV